MKLLFVTPYYVPAWRYGGPPQCMADLAKNFTSQHHTETHVVTLNANGPETLFETHEPVTKTIDGVTVHYLPRAKNFTGKAYFNSSLIDDFLDRYKGVDIVHVHTLFNAFSKKGMQFAVKNNIPFILTPHGMLSDYSLKKSAVLKKIHRLFFDDALMRKAYCVHFTAQGEAQRAVIDAGIKKVIIPLGFEFDSNEKFEEKKDTGIFRMMFLGRLQPIKGLEPLLSAIAELNDTIKKRFVFNIYGGDENNYRQHLEKLIKSLQLESIVKLCGPVDATSRTEAFKQHDVLALTSFHENFGMAAAEAMAAGLPVLLSDQVSLASFVQENRCGWVSPIEKNKLQKTVHEMFYTTLAERNAMGQRGFQAVRNHFSMAVVGRQFMQLYNQARRTVQMLIALMAVIYLPSCKSPSPDTTPPAPTDSAVVNETEANVPDTLRMRPERQVIFFLPGDEEINSMTEADKEGQVIETISDFIYYSSMVCDSLSTMGILCAPVTSPVIMTQDTVAKAFLFYRKNAQHITGMIVYDGVSEPEVFYGVADYAEWMGIIKNKLKLN